MIRASVVNELRQSSLMILQKSIPTCREAELAFSVFSIWVFFHKYHDSQDNRGKGRVSLYIISTTSVRFIYTLALVRLFLKRANLCA